MSSNEEQADQLYKKAMGKKKAWICFGNRNEDVVTLLKKAANLYKIDKKYEKAAECYKEMVKPHEKDDSPYDAANDWLNAGNMYAKTEGNEEKGIVCFKAAADSFLRSGKFSRAAKCEDQIGNLLETKENFDEAIKHYQMAADYFENENLKTQSLDSKKKIAHLLAVVGEYDKAIEEFEKIGDFMTNDKCLKWNAKGFYFKAVICHLCRAGSDLDEELENIKENYENYKEKDVHFNETNETEFLDKAIEAIAEESPKQFAIACKRHERIIDNFLVKLLLRVRKNMEKALEDNQ